MASPSPLDSRFTELKAGKSLEFAAPHNGRETPLEKAARTIPATWLEQLVTNPERVVPVPIKISNAIIEGSLSLEYSSFEREVLIRNCEFRDSVNLSFSHFARSATFERCNFLGCAIFRAAHAEADFTIAGSTFADGASFEDAKVEQVLLASGATFGKVSFERITISKSAFFRLDDRGRRTTFAGKAVFLDSHINNNAEFNGAQFEEEVDFTGLQVDGSIFFGLDDQGGRTSFLTEANFATARIGGTADFRGVQFGGEANFSAIQVGESAFFRVSDQGTRTAFAGGAVFVGAQINGNVEFVGAEFQAEANFEGLHVDGSAIFRSESDDNRTVFTTEVNFLTAHIGGTADFRGVQFEGEADFTGIDIGESIFFRADDDGTRTTFADKTKFLDARIGGTAYFEGAKFLAEARFTRIQVGGSLVFSTAKDGLRSSFAGIADFGGAQIMGNAEFNGAEFKARSRFEAMQVEGSASFLPDIHRNRVIFSGSVDFNSAIFSSRAHFNKVGFEAGANFDDTQFKSSTRFVSAEFAPTAQTTFIGSRFQHNAYFNRTKFQGKADFTAAVAERALDLSGATLSGPTVFREARMQVLFFGYPAGNRKRSPRWKLGAGEFSISNATTIGGPIDLRGLTYDRIYVDLKRLLPQLTPFDRQPYSQLEGALRKVGADKRAHQVYLERRHVERKKKFRLRSIHLWFFDWLYWKGANYGVRPYWLIVYTLLLILFGGALFSQPKALEKSSKASASADCSRAFGVSVHYFLPMDTPIGADCVPSSTAVRFSVRNHSLTPPIRPDWYGTFLRVAGTVLMGLGVAAITGLLRRIAPQ